MKTLAPLIFVFLPGAGFCQDRNWMTGMSFSEGLNYSAIRRGDQESLVGNSFGTTLFLRYHKRRSGVFFEPAIWFGKNSIRARATEEIHVKMRQYGIGVAPSGGVMLGSGSFLKVGLLGEYVGYPWVEAVNSAGVHLGHSAFSDEFQKREFLTAMTVVLAVVAGESKALEFQVGIHQYLQCPFLQPFKLDGLGAAGENVYNARALSTVVLAGISVKFVKPKKENTE